MLDVPSSQPYCLVPELSARQLSVGNTDCLSDLRAPELSARQLSISTTDCISDMSDGQLNLNLSMTGESIDYGLDAYNLMRMQPGKSSHIQSIQKQSRDEEYITCL